jgi:hypothetical protein
MGIFDKNPNSYASKTHFAKTLDLDTVVMIFLIPGFFSVD